MKWPLLYCHFNRRLRDKLLEDDRFTLAQEVSTKCNLDMSAVWAAWGMACLRAGKYEDAREKFSRCLGVCPVD
jgi:zinc finger FYVE domain-containing protein 26